MDYFVFVCEGKPLTVLLVLVFVTGLSERNTVYFCGYFGLDYRHTTSAADVRFSV